MHTKTSFIGTLILTLLFGIHLSSQPSFEKADAIALAFDQPVENVEELAHALTAELSTDKERARAFYMWIAQNISYDCRKFHNPTRPTFTGYTDKEIEEKINRWEQKQLKSTLKRKKGICEDYSRLFKALCDAVGMKCIVVKGDARDFYRPFRKGHNNPHAWNAVKIDNKWHLLDATWGAGYTDPEVRRFTRRITTGFFFTPPSWFIQNHIPDEENWQLLENPISRKEFATQPVINYGDTKFNIKDFSPQVTLLKENEATVWLAFEHRPSVLVVTNTKGKPLKYTLQEKDEKIILTFSKSSLRSIVVYGGESKRSQMDWLAKYQL